MPACEWWYSGRSDTARRWAESSAAPDIVAGFDQEATALLMARVSTFRVEHEETFDLLRWLDRTLIRVGTKFGEYQRDAPETFRMPAGGNLPSTHHTHVSAALPPISQSRSDSYLFQNLTPSMSGTLYEPRKPRTCSTSVEL